MPRGVVPRASRYHFCHQLIRPLLQSANSTSSQVRSIMTSDSVRAPRSWTPRPVYRLSIIIALILLVILTLSPYKPELPKPSSFFGGQSNMDSRCSPHDWNDGAWVRNPNAKPIQSPVDVYAASGFSGCASTREVGLHMGTDKLDKLHWRQNISSWTWTPNGGKCLDVARTGLGEELLIDLVQRGGWLLVGGKPSCF